MCFFFKKGLIKKEKSVTLIFYWSMGVGVGVGVSKNLKELR